MNTNKIVFKLLPALATVMSLITAVGCGWGVDGTDRMDKLYPPDVQDVSGEVAVTDVMEDVQADVEPDIADDVSVGVDGEVVDDTVWPDVSYVDLEGRWAVRLVAKASLNAVLAVAPMTTTDLFVAEKTESGLSLTFCDELIDVESSESFSSDTTTKAALREAMGLIPVTVAVEGNAITAQEIVWKWALADTIGNDDTLPEDPSLTNYPDIDNDTFAGFTMAVSVVLADDPHQGERYMAKRVKFNLAEGTMSEDGRWISGTMTCAVEEKLLGADEFMLEMAATITPVAEGTGYQFRRVDDTLDCATLVASHERLFRFAP